MKKAKKNIILLIAAAAVLIAAVFGLNIQSVDEYYSGGADGSSSEIQSRTVTLEIRCDTVLKNYEELDNRLKSDVYFRCTQTSVRISKSATPVISPQW